MKNKPQSMTPDQSREQLFCDRNWYHNSLPWVNELPHRARCFFRPGRAPREHRNQRWTSTGPSIWGKRPCTAVTRPTINTFGSIFSFEDFRAGRFASAFPQLASLLEWPRFTLQQSSLSPTKLRRAWNHRLNAFVAMFGERLRHFSFFLEKFFMTKK